MSDLRELCLPGYHSSGAILRDRVIETVCAGPRLDGVSGFSQGAAPAGPLIAIQGSGSAPLEFQPEFHLDFAIMADGFTSDLPKHAELFRHTLTTPTVNAIGCSDVIAVQKENTDV